MKEKKDRVEDAMHATKAAVEEGCIVAGGGVALLPRQGRYRQKPQRRQCRCPVRHQYRAQSARSADPADRREFGRRGSSIVVGKVLANKSQTFGFDAQTEQYVDMLSAGIVDPAKVVRVALQDAASISGLMVTTEAMVAEAARRRMLPQQCQAAAEWAGWTIDRIQ